MKTMQSSSGHGTGAAVDNARVLRVYERLAARYDKFIRFPERVFFQGGRQWACSQASGEVLEVGIGTGRNLPFYRDDVRLTGVDLSPGMLEIARRRAREQGRAVDLRVGDAQALEFPEDRFDAVVFTLSLCTIPDDRKAVAEARRVLRRSGRLILLEHVRSPKLAVRWGQRIIEPIALWLEADHLLREPLDQVTVEGLEVITIERSRLGIVERLVARKPV